jgi:hypothetical protein
MNKDDRLYPFTVLVTDNKYDWIRSTPCGQYSLWYGKNINDYVLRGCDIHGLSACKSYVLPRLTNLYKLLHA